MRSLVGVAEVEKLVAGGAQVLVTTLAGELLGVIHRAQIEPPR